MTEFQVGDRVSVEGVVTDVWPDSKDGPMSMIQIADEGTPNEIWVRRIRRRLSGFWLLD